MTSMTNGNRKGNVRSHFLYCFINYLAFLILSRDGLGQKNYIPVRVELVQDSSPQKSQFLSCRVKNLFGLGQKKPSQSWVGWPRSGSEIGS